MEGKGRSRILESGAIDAVVLVTREGAFWVYMTETWCAACISLNSLTWRVKHVTVGSRKIFQVWKNVVIKFYVLGITQRDKAYQLHMHRMNDLEVLHNMLHRWKCVVLPLRQSSEYGQWEHASSDWKISTTSSYSLSAACEKCPMLGATQSDWFSNRTVSTSTLPDANFDGPRDRSGILHRRSQPLIVF